MVEAGKHIKILRLMIVILLLVVLMFPLYWMIITALQPVGGYAGDRTPHIIPKIVTLESFIFILKQEGFLKQFLNT